MANQKQYARGYDDGYCGRPANYGCHVGMRSTLERDRAAYREGYDQGRRDRLSDIHEDHKFDAMNEGDE